MGTFLKSLIPSIRMNYMVLPPKLLEIYKNNFSSYNQTVSKLHQDTLYKFMASGHWARHLNKMRTIYKKKHTILISMINKYMNEKVKIIGENSGLHIILEINNGMSEKELINSALKMNIKVYPTSVYYYKNTNTNTTPCIMLGFGSLSEKLISKGIKLLKEAWNL